MTISKFVFGALLGSAAVVSAVAGCGSTTNISTGGGTSAAGQSCTRTFDCEEGLSCIESICVASATPVGDAGADGTTQMMMTAGPHLGARGDSCQTPLDCSAGLDCVPTVGGASVCDVTNYGLMPTGKVCNGECSTGLDCCELPTSIGLATILDGGAESTVHTCQDLITVFLGGSTVPCASALPLSTLSRACFYYNTYCAPGCGANTWSCNGGHCAYAGTCTLSTADDQNGCPSRSRTGGALTTTCNATSHTCTPAGCTMDADCAGLPVADTSFAYCEAGDCVCNAGACYLACSKDNDCSSSYVCDPTKHLCVTGSCMTNQDCAVQLGNVQAKCMSGACKLPCVTDHDCSSSGDVPGTTFGGNVCVSGVCTPLGCSSDMDCATAGLHSFCTAPAATSTVAVHSAVTN